MISPPGPPPPRFRLLRSFAESEKEMLKNFDAAFKPFLFILHVNIYLH